MNYKEALFFTGACLTINHDAQNLERITEQIKSTEIDWDEIVKVSTSHYVFPALYVNLKRAGLLEYLPEELVQYMEHITSLNRDRNANIIEQAKEINSLLIKNDISPIFLKGTGFLLHGLYFDIAERMVGDIDFLVSEQDFLETIKIIEEAGYQKTQDRKLENPVFSKHYPRVYHEDRVAAVEIHLQMVKGNLSDSFNYISCKPNLILKDEINCLGYEDQLSLAILAKQHNDDNILYKRVNLRSSYDVFLLSRLADQSKLPENYSFYKDLLNPYLALSSIVLSSSTILHNKDETTRSFLKTALKKLDSFQYAKRHDSKMNRLINLKIKFQNLGRYFSNSEYRKYYTRKILKP